jgi:hypothetical protein
MRRLTGLVVLIVLLAIPATALAKTVGHSFTLGHGFTGRTFTIHLARRGAVTVVLSYSRVTNPHADILVSLRKSTWPEDVLLIDSASGGCTHTATTITCRVSDHPLPRGKYFVAVSKETQAAAPVRLRLTWPA